MKTLHPLLMAAAMSLISGPAVWAAEPATNSIKFSDPSRAGTFKVHLARGDIRVVGSDTTEITVKSESQPAATGQRKNGLRVLSTSSAFTLTEKDNVVTLEGGGDSPASRADFEVTMPRQANLVIENSWGGKVHVSGVAGDLEIAGMNGEVTLEDVSGSAVVQTMNGEINATVAKMSENRPLSFTSMNGAVVIRLPSDSKANVRLRTHNGAILTDFPEEALVTKVESLGGSGWTHSTMRSTGRAPRAAVLPPEAQEAIREASRAAVEATRHAAQAFREAAEAAREGAESARGPGPRAPRAPTPPIPPISGGKLVSGALNGGGSEINVTTMNGDVTLRQLERK